jgi:hypothetical protein
MVPRALIILSAVVGLMVLGPGSTHAQEDVPVQVDLVADRTELTIGDRVSMTLDVTYPTGFQVVLPRLPSEWGALEVLDQSKSRVVDNEDGTVTISQTIEVTAFSPGEFLTPALEISVREPAGGFSVKTAPPVGLNVTSVLVEGDEDLRDIRPQADLDVPPVWPWVLGGLLIMALIGVAIYLFLRRRREEAAAAPVLDLRTAYEIAIDELARITKLDLPGEARFKEHYALVADVVRTYIEAEYLIPAMDRTTRELKAALQLAPIDVPSTREVIAFLSDCDLVKFTELRPDMVTAVEATGEARRLVDMIRPAPEPEPDSDSGSGSDTLGMEAQTA